MQLLIAALNIAALLFGLYCLRRQSVSHLLTLALLVTGGMSVYYPVLSYFIEPITWRNVHDIPYTTLLASQGDYLCFTLGLVFIAAAMGGKTPTANSLHARSSAEPVIRDTVVCLSLLAIGLVLYSKFVSTIGFAALTNRDNYAEKHLASSGMGPLKLGLDWIIVACLWAEAGRISPMLKKAFRGVALAVAYWSLAYLSSRSYVVMLVSGYAIIVTHRRSYRLGSVRPELVLAAALAYVGMEFFMLYRGAYSGGFVATMHALSDFGVWQDHLGVLVGGSEFSHPFITCMEIEYLEEPGDLRGLSYLETPLLCMPLSIFPDRPLTLSEAFVADNYAMLADRGGGTAFSLVAESWWNVGAFWGPFVVAAALGWILITVERRAVRVPNGLVARMLPVAAFVIVTAHRNTIALIFKQLVMLSLPAVAIFVVLVIAASTMRLTANRPGRPATSSRSGAVRPRLASL